MPNANLVQALIASRLPRALDAWRERLDYRLRDTECRNLVLVELIRATRSYDEVDIDEAEKALHIHVVEQLGAFEYVVDLRDPHHQNQLAKSGHLSITAADHRLTAI